MCASESTPSHSPKRKAYEKPALEKLSLEDAKKLLESQSGPTDEHLEELLKEINRKLEEQSRF